MNCQMFDDVVSVVAREQMMDAVEREAALSHAAVCRSCAERLTNERALSLELRQLAVAMETAAVSPRVEQQLMAHFDSQLPAKGRVFLPRRWRYAAAAIAAVLLVALGFGSWQRRGITPSIPPAKTTVVAMNDRPTEIVSLSAKPVVPVAPLPAKLDRSRPQRNISKPTPDLEVKEVATDFIPVMYTPADFEPGGQVVRVELPRVAMARFGLPVNMDRADQRVKADVLVGPDGLARAIRFVQ